jgi:hypothetical protein
LQEFIETFYLRIDVVDLHMFFVLYADELWKGPTARGYGGKLH